MADPVLAQKSPFAVNVQEGRKYWWCACGMSKKQPFCDGSHKGSGFGPVEYQATASRTVYFCGCKRTGKSPLCDGAHNRI
jgi:CDGSH-type Zn-finger protein